MNIPWMASPTPAKVLVAPAASAPRRAGGRGRRQHRGQSLVEFAIVLPVMLAIGGVLIDVARLYQAWITLESATRDAAQYLATSSTDATSPDYTWAGENADNKAAYILSLATEYPVERSANAGALASCATPQVMTSYTQVTTFASGGSVANPLSTATVTVCLPFHTIFPYPFLTTNNAFFLRTQGTMSVLVGR